MKQPNQHLKHLVRNLNWHTNYDEPVYEIMSDGSEYYIKQVINDSYHMTIRGSWKFKGKLTIILFKAGEGASIDHTERTVEVVKSECVHGVVNDLQTLVNMNWIGSRTEETGWYK
ncbi:hypothetical protein ACFPYJ_07700 [Paenibacillus solisilvae]|uniref:Uncharacterized protein n=1 Tax=Paenibacillus solisilvae TaxID=2486751 RepID=A0ABW0VW68_9BACL